jgi:hypothetical protein
LQPVPFTVAHLNLGACGIPSVIAPRATSAVVSCLCPIPCSHSLASGLPDIPSGILCNHGDALTRSSGQPMNCPKSFPLCSTTLSLPSGCICYPVTLLINWFDCCLSEPAYYPSSKARIGHMYRHVKTYIHIAINIYSYQSNPRLNYPETALRSGVLLRRCSRGLLSDL